MMLDPPIFKNFLLESNGERVHTLCSENAEEMASGEEARFWADLNQKYIT